MNWILVALGCLAALVALVALVGALLPKAHVASRRALVHRPPQEVWELLADVDAYPSWRPELTQVQRQPDRDGRLAWSEVGKHDTIAYERVEATAPLRMVHRIADPELPFGGTWTFAIEAAPGGSQVTITEHGEVYNVIFRFMARYFLGYTSNLDAMLRAMGQRFGEDLTPTSVG